MRTTSRLLPPMLGFITAIGPLSTDMYLPAFPAIEATYRSGEGSAQITLAAWFVGLAVGQITQGTLADRLGRRAPLMAGLALYILASAGCALAPDLLSLSVLRAVAAFGGSAGMVLPRAVVRDLAEGHAAARLMAQLMLVMGVAPILAPTLGGAMLGVASWRSIFWFGAVFGLIALLLVWRMLPETLPPGQRVRLGLAGLLSRYRGILSERSFVLNTLTQSWGTFSMFAYISGSPPVYELRFGLTPAQYGVAFGLCSIGYIGGSQLNHRTIRRFGASRVQRIAIRCFLASTMVLLTVAVTDRFGLLGVVLPILVGMTCMGFVMPNATVGALSRHAAHAGSASALLGTVQYLLAAGSGTLAGVLTDGTARPMAACMMVGAVCATVADAMRRPV